MSDDRTTPIRPTLVHSGDPELPDFIGGFTVEQGNLRWGPFGTANDAAQWACTHLSAEAAWVIRPYLNTAAER